MQRSSPMVQPILACSLNLDVESHNTNGGISTPLKGTNSLINGPYVNFDQHCCGRQAIGNRFESLGESVLFRDTQLTIDVNRFKSDKKLSAATVNGKSNLIDNRHTNNHNNNSNNDNNSKKNADYSTSNSTAFLQLANPTDLNASNKLIVEHSNDTNHTNFMKNNSEQVFDCSLSPTNIAQAIKAEIINRNDKKELASAMSANSFDRATKLNHLLTKSSTTINTVNSNSSSTKLTKSSTATTTTTTTTTTTMTTTINTSIKSNSTHTKCSEVLIVKNSTSRKLGGFVDKIANLTKYDPMSHLGRHLIKHNYDTPTSTHANHNNIANNASSCGESSTASKSCSSTPSSVAVSMNSSAKSSISNLSSTGGMSCINSVPYVDHHHANQTVIQQNTKNSNSALLSNTSNHLQNHQSSNSAQSTNNLCRPTINIIEQTTQFGSQSTLRCDSKNEENCRSPNVSANFQKSSTYNNLMEYQSNHTNSQPNNSSASNMDQTQTNSSKFHYSASANNICGSINTKSSQDIAADSEQGKNKKSSVAKSFLSVDPANSSKNLRKKAKKEAKRAKAKHQENVEQLRMLVDYLHHNSKPLSLSLEAEEIELARSYKLNSKLCDDCLSTSEYSNSLLPPVPVDISRDGNEQQPAQIRLTSESSSSDIIRCHRCRKPIERPESTISHFSDSAITNSDQDSNDENKSEEPQNVGISKPKEQAVPLCHSKLFKYRHTDDILDKFLAKQKGHIVARAARRGSVFQPKLLFVSFKKDCKFEDISQFAKCLPMRSWTSELFLASQESSQLLDPAVKRELLSNYSYEDFRHVLTPELSHFSNNIESMLAMNDRRRKSLNANKKHRIRFRKFSQVGSDKMWDVDRLQQKNRKIYQERLQVIRNVPNGSSVCSDSSGLNLDDKNFEAFDSMIDTVGIDSADYEGSDSQINDDYDDPSKVHHNLENIDALLLAREMTLVSRDLMLAIDHIELARILLEPHLVDTKNCPNIVILLDFDRRIYHLLITEIVSRSEVEDRVGAIVKLIDVAVILNGLKNYFSLNSVISALHSPPVARLNSTWTSLKHRYIDKYDSLVKLSNQVMTTYDLTDLNEPLNSDDREKEMNLRQMIDNCCIPQFELVVNQMKKSILECMQSKVNHFPTQSTPLPSNQIKFVNEVSNHNNDRRVGTWTNPQNLAVWIDHEINSLIQELEAKNAQQKSKTKRRSTKWLRGRRNSSHSNNSTTKNNDSEIGGITKSLSDASIAPTNNELSSHNSLWSRLLSKKRRVKFNPKETSSGQSINQEESRKSSLSDKSLNAGLNPNSKIMVSVSDLTTPVKHDLHQPKTSIVNSILDHTAGNQEAIDDIERVTPGDTSNTQVEFSNLSKAISESYHYLLSSISEENKKFIMNLIHTWLLELQAKMDSTLANIQDSSPNKDKSSCDAREFLLMQAYRPLKECLTLSLQHEPLTKEEVLTNEAKGSELSSSNSTERVTVKNDNILESTRL